MTAEPESSSLESCSICGTPMDVADFEPLSTVVCPVCGESVVVGRFIGEFELLEVMGRGGMGVVYRARDTNLDRQLALKLLRGDQAQSGALGELELEAGVTASINHPHVVKVFTTGSAAGRFYIAMELVDKGTLDDLLELQGRVAEPQGLEIAVQIAQGLRAAHQHGLIHRDIKPGNILFSDAHTAKIVDFGLAIMEQAAHGTGEIWGTPYYVSPERLDQKKEDFRSDIYSFGATMFHALAGRPPFEAANATLVALKHLRSHAVSLQAFAPWISGSTAFVINRTLQKDPADRYQSYDELIEHLEYARAEAAKGGGTPQPKTRVVIETAEDRKREGLLTTAMIGFVVLLLLGGGWFWYASSGPKVDPSVSAITMSVGASGKNAQSYEAARQLLIKGKPAEAAPQFHALAVEKKTSEPLAQWAFAQEGIAWLVAGNLPKAREAFTALGARPYKGKEAAAKKLDPFFKKLAALGSTPAPVPHDEVRGLDANTYGALGLLVAGLKNWELGKLEEGAAMLRDFSNAAPGGGYGWISEYHVLAEDNLADFTDYRGALAMAKGAKSVTELQSAAKTVRKIKESLRHPKGRLADLLEQAAKDAEAVAAEQIKKAAAQLEAEKKALGEARGKAAAQARDWKFKEAREVIAPVALANADFQREQRLLLKKIDWLQAFKDGLIKDLAAGFPGPLRAKDGSEIAGAVTKADENGLEVAGAVKKWTDLAPASILALAESFVAAAPPPEQAGRRWLAGVYAAMGGLKADARRLLLEAAKESPRHADELPLLISPKRTNVAKGKPVTSSDPKQAGSAEGPEKALDGDANTRWSSTQKEPKWLRVDLGQSQSISRWVLKHASSHKDSADLDTSDFSLHRSDDDKTWTKIEEVKGNILGITDRRVPAFSARYVKLSLEKPNRKSNDPAARLYEWELYASDPAQEPVGDLFATPPSAPAPELTGRDIGLAANEPTGGHAVDDRTGLFTIRSGGNDIGGAADAFRFVHRPLSGDGQIIVRIEAVERGNDASKAGIMFRENAEPGARMVFLAASPVPGLSWQTRKEPKAAAGGTREANFAAPCWLKIERAGNVFTGSASKDGAKWTQIGKETINLPAPAEAGLAVTARQTGSAATGKMEVIALGK